MRPTTTAGDALPIERKRRALGSALALAWLVGLVVAAALLAPRPLPPTRARLLAQSQLRDLLDSGEAVGAEAAVMQRRWWDYFRPTRGLLVATDRRLLYLGVPPQDVLQPERDAVAVDTLVFPSDTTVHLGPRRDPWGSAPGLVVAAPEGEATFSVPPRDWDRVRAVMAVVARRQAAQRDTAASERAAAELAAWQARQPIYHRIERGEALISIARQYNTTPEVLMELNHLTSDRVRVGDTLLVKPQT